MESPSYSTEKRRPGRAKVIPWHCQIRFQSSFQHSINNTINTAIYNKKIKSLMHNNKYLAKELERCKCELSHKNNLLQTIVQKISFSSYKLTEASKKMKEAVATVDETIAEIGSCLKKGNLSEFNGFIANRNNLKKKLKSITKDLSLEEIAENVENDSVIESNIKSNFNDENDVNKEKENLILATINSNADKVVLPRPKKQCKADRQTVSQKVVKRVPKTYITDSPPSYLPSESESFKVTTVKIKKAPKPSVRRAKHEKNLEVLSFGSDPEDLIHLKDQQNDTSSSDKCTTGLKKKGFHNPCLSNIIKSCASNKYTHGFPSPVKKSKPVKKQAKPSTASEVDNIQDAYAPQISLCDVKVVLERKSYLESDSLLKKKTIPLREIYEFEKQLRKKAVSKAAAKAPTLKNQTSALVKKSRCIIQVDAGDEIVQLRDKRKVAVANQKRPLAESSYNVASQKRPLVLNPRRICFSPLPVKRVCTSPMLQEWKKLAVVAEVHHPPETECEVDAIGLLNSQPSVVLNDVLKTNKAAVEAFKNLKKLACNVEETKEAQLPVLASIENLNMESDKENKIDSHFCKGEERKSRRACSRVPTYKEKNLITKLRR